MPTLTKHCFLGLFLFFSASAWAEEPLLTKVVMSNGYEALTKKSRSVRLYECKIYPDRVVIRTVLMNGLETEKTISQEVRNVESLLKDLRYLPKRYGASEKANGYSPFGWAGGARVYNGWVDGYGVPIRFECPRCGPNDKSAQQQPPYDVVQDLTFLIDQSCPEKLF